MTTVPTTTAPPPVPASSGSSMWDPVEYGEPLETLDGLTFLLLDATVREGIKVRFQDNGVEREALRDAVDLVVATTSPGETRTFSGFAAGIVGQVKRKGPNDLPAVCRIRLEQTRRGPTKVLELVDRAQPGGDEGAALIARGLAPTPIGPLQR